jgi:SagB-type dehydrogenase family enzyme
MAPESIDGDSIARPNETIALSPPVLSGPVPFEAALARRRSVRHFTGEPVSTTDLSQMLWAAQGVSGADQHGPVRTAPSSGRSIPLEVYAITRDGFGHYLPEGHQLEMLHRDDLRPALAEAAGGQGCMSEAVLVIAVTAVIARTAEKYEARAGRYVALEAGHAVQNVLLQATALGLGAVPVGSFDDTRVSEVLGLPKGCDPLYLVAVGHPGKGRRG